MTKMEIIGNTFFHTTLMPTPKPQIPPTLLMLLDTRPKEDKKQRQFLFCPFVSSHFSLYQLTTRTFHPLNKVFRCHFQTWKEVTWYEK